ncbi:MAG: ATP-binding protein [Blastocatellia bacterium]
MITRHIKDALRDALADTPVVLLTGARQAGKSTLVEHMAETDHPARYMTLDDAAVLSAARFNAAGFISELDAQPVPVVLDEIQRAPELFLPIKLAVDRNRRSGKFLLTRSANVMMLPHLADSLAGRMETIRLWPLSQGEIDGVRESFIDRVFAKELALPARVRFTRADLIARVVRGGYPEILNREAEPRRRAWFGSYITTILQRDVREIANIEGLAEMPRLMTLLASRAASLLNFSEISRSLVIPQSTLKRYMGLLEATFIVQMLPAWSANIGKRLVKAPKLTLCDTGLLSYLLGVNEERLEKDSQIFGAILENFVVMELRKQASWSETQPQLFHFRTQSGQEVDIVLEGASGEIVGVEVKASGSVSGGDFKGLTALRETAGRKFKRGVILYTGQEIVQFDEHFIAFPVAGLWKEV